MALLDRLVPVVQWMPWPWNLAGVLPMGVGGLVIWRSMVVLSSHGTSAEPFQVATSLVTTGPFRLSRNPMYVGATLVLVGIAVALGTATPFLVLPLYLSAMQLRVIRPEEDMIRARFGEAYARYQATVRRWL
jgi:protein-S-isoprenylcysteine O-methyltransferase Ste14